MRASQIWLLGKESADIITEETEEQIWYTLWECSQKLIIIAGIIYPEETSASRSLHASLARMDGFLTDLREMIWVHFAWN